MKAKIAEGVRLFNSQKYFETHEVLEEVWLKTEGEKKIFLHGLIQVAAAFHHHTRDNPTGFHSLLEKGLKKLENFAEDEEGIELGGLRQQLQPWRDHLKAACSFDHAHEPLLPQIKMKKQSEAESERRVARSPSTPAPITDKRLPTTVILAPQPSPSFYGAPTRKSPNTETGTLQLYRR